jgi:hypothetical protein
MMKLLRCLDGPRMIEVMPSPSDCMAAVRRKCSGTEMQTQLVAYIESKQRTREVLSSLRDTAGCTRYRLTASQPCSSAHLVETLKGACFSAAVLHVPQSPLRLTQICIAATILDCSRPFYAWPTLGKIPKYITRIASPEPPPREASKSGRLR